MRRPTVLVLIVLAQLCAASVASAQGRYSLSAEAMPASIFADGKSYSQIIISITETDGRPAPDATEVRVSTTAGSVTNVAYSGGGRATAILTSTSAPEIAIVTASAGGASASVQVEFSSLAGAVSLGDRTIRMEGGSLAYSVERDVIFASDGVSIEYNGLSITAPTVQVSEPLGMIKAQGQVFVTRGDESLHADAFIYDLRTDRCRILTDGACMNGPANSIFKTGSLRKSNVGATEFSPLAADTTKTWIVARKLTMFPREKIQFSKASLYLGNTHVVNLPYYIYDYNNRGALLDQIRYTKYEGLVADIPFYYRVTDAGSGALKLRYAERGSDYGGYFHPRKGPSLALEQAYALGERSEGRIFVDALSDKARSFELTQHQEFGSPLQNGRADLSLRYQPDSTYAKGLYTAYLNGSFSMHKYDCYVTSYVGGSQVPQWNPENLEDIEYVGRSNGSVRATIRPRHSFGMRGMNLSPSLSLGYGRLGFGSSASAGECLYQTLGLNLRSSPIGSRKCNLTFDGLSEFTLAADGRAGTSLRTGMTMRRSWRGGSTSLSYTLNLHQGAVANLYSSSRHTVGGTLFAGGPGGKWNCYTYFGYGLDNERLNLYSSASYRLDKRWKIRGDYSLYRYKFSTRTYSFTSEMSYLKAGIYRPIGPYEVGIAWSPTGQQYWSNGGKKLWLEVGLPGF